MNNRDLYSFLFSCLWIVGLLTQSHAQTITTGALTYNPICAGTGGAVTVAFTTSGTFISGNTFSAQLSDAAGAFSGSPTVIGTSKTVSAISATISPTIPAGSGYKVRVVSSSPVVTGPVSTGALVVKPSPAAPSTTTPAPYCEGIAPAPLVATPATGGVLRWYGTNATGGTGSGTATLPSTNVIGNTAYYVSQTVDGCEGPRASIVVSVKPKPATPGTSPVSYCTGQMATALSASPSAGGTLNWYGTNATDGMASSVAPTPNSNATYYVSQTVNGCESARAGIVVAFINPPATPIATAPGPYCEGVSVPALTATGQGLRWYGTNATGGTSSNSATVPSTTLIGTTNYYVSQTVNGCEGPRTAIPVQVKDTPAAPAATLAPAYCQNQVAAALVATPSTGGTLNWYGTNATGGTASGSTITPNTTQAGTITYYVGQTLDGCAGPRTAIGVTVRPTPAAPATTPVIACQNRPATALSASAAANATLNWYGTNATGGAGSDMAPVPETDALGVRTYYVSQIINGCEGARSGLSVTVNSVPAAPSATPPSAYCEGSAAQALVATGQNLRWYDTNAMGGASSGSATVPGTNVIGTTNYYVAQTVSGCESNRTAIPVLVKDTPDMPGTASVDFCQGTQPPTLTAALAANATPNWFGTDATGGTASGTAPILGNSSIGTTTYYVSQTLDGCPGPRASLNVRVKPLPGQPGVSTAAFCNNRGAEQLRASGERLKWYSNADSFISTDAPVPATNSIGDQFYKVSQTNGEGCEGPKATLKVTIKPLPGQPSVSNVNYCQAQTDQPAQNVSALNAGGQGLRWFNPDGNAFPNAPTPSIDRAGVQTYQVSQTVDNCEGERATLQVAVNSVAAPTVAKPVVTYCINEKATPLQATIETGGRAQWRDPYDRLTNEAPTPSTINTNVDPAGDRFFVYQIGSNGCYSPRSVIRVIINTTPTLSLVAPVSIVNLGQRVPLKLTFTGSAPYSYSIAGGYTGTSLTNDTTIAVLPRGNITYQVTAVSNGCGVGLPGNPATALVMVRTPTVATGTLTNSTLCAGTSLTVPFETTGQFNAGNTFRFELVSSADTTKKYDIPATASASPITATLPGTIPSGQYAVRVKALNPEVGITGTNSPTQLTVRSLPSATLTGTQTIYEGMPANLTIAFGGDGPWALTYADSVRSYSVATAVSPYVAEVRPARTTTYRITTVTNSCGSGPLSSTATISVLPLLGVEDNSLDPLVTVYPVPTGHLLTVEIDLPLTRGPVKLSLTTMQGRSVVQNTTYNRRTELDLSGQPSGLYILHIQVGDRYTVRKVMKL